MDKNRYSHQGDDGEPGIADIIAQLRCLIREVRMVKASIASESKAAYTNKDVMEMFQIASATLKKWRDTGLLGYSVVGSIYLYSREDIAKFLEDHHFSSYSTKNGFLKSIRNL